MASEELKRIAEQNLKNMLKNQNDLIKQKKREKRRQKVIAFLSSKVIIGVLIIIFVLGLSFYWFEWKPSEIRKSCVKEAYTKGNSSIDPVFKAMYPSTFPNNTMINNYYRLCLIRNGMKPESMLVNLSR